jgi:hypothetical protein
MEGGYLINTVKAIIKSCTKNKKGHVLKRDLIFIISGKRNRI